MNIIEYIKDSVERVGCAFVYNAEGETNDIVARTPEFSSEPPVVLCYLLKNGTTEQVGGSWVERVNVGLFFSKVADYDFDGVSNEDKLELCKRYAQRWLQSLVGSPVLRLVSVNSTERVYNTTTDILTAYAVNVTIGEVQGVTLCGEPLPRVLDIVKNGEYDLRGYDTAIVNIPKPKTKLQDKSINITENDYYELEPDAEYDGLYLVGISVEVPLRMSLKNIDVILDYRNYDGKNIESVVGYIAALFEPALDKGRVREMLKLKLSNVAGGERGQDYIYFNHYYMNYIFTRGITIKMEQYSI